jgi:hypothetical protein
VTGVIGHLRPPAAADQAGAAANRSSNRPAHTAGCHANLLENRLSPLPKMH